MLRRLPQCTRHRCLTALLLGSWLAQACAAGWFTDGRPGPLARQALAVLADAPSQGLDPADYATAALTQAVADASRGNPADAPAAEHLASALERAMQQYLADLHQGRVDPRQIRADFTLPSSDGFDARVALQAALDSGGLAGAVQAASPQMPQYQRLREVLARYRALGAHEAWQEPLPPLPRPAGQLGEGAAWPGIDRLARRLAALGDLAAPPAPTPSAYDAALAAAVRSFQRRHGLVEDGIVGRATLAALEVPPAARVRQIELMLERLRWTPLFQGRRMVVVNIPEFVLRAYEVVDGRIQVRAMMRVVVGKALDTRTPLIDEAMRFIEFSPYWNIPPSIARAETVPRLRRDPGYFSRQGLEFVGADGRADSVLTAAKLDAVLGGRLRIRQRPGPLNALGDIKFVFPNRQNIYLHHTPATALFDRERRDFSHGCIRVQDPVALAHFVLNDMPQWSDDRIRQAMGAGTSSTLALRAPVPVLIAYGTALVKDGRIHFFDDIYGHDRLLDTALRERTRRLTTQRP